MKAEVKELFDQANLAAAKVFEGRKRQLYSRLKLEGNLEAPVNLCVTCDPSRNGPHVLGRNTIRETDVYSTCCAIQNLWLAARGEGVGVGWVSIFEPVQLGSAANSRTRSSSCPICAWKLCGSFCHDPSSKLPDGCGGYRSKN